MRAVQLAFLCFVVSAAGCAQNSATVLLERDLRHQEDKIYKLECILEQCHAEHEATLRENEALKKELATGDRGPGYDTPTTTPSRPAPVDRTPRTTPQVEVPKLEVPTIELPESTPPAGATPSTDSGALREGTPTQLVINQRLTGGLDRDGRGGDEGLMVVVEPRDAGGHLVRAKGAVAMALLDPAESGESSRVARWDFSAQDVQHHYVGSVLGRGLQFQLPWPGEPPKNSELRLYVRFITEDGQKLNAELPIDVRPPASKGWAPNHNASRPGSRLKSAPRYEAPRAQRTDNGYSTEPRAELDRGADDVERGQRAAQPQRPTWKPYR
jgi:hypothetical protein